MSSSISFGDHVFTATNHFVPPYNMSNTLDQSTILNFIKTQQIPSSTRVFVPNDDSVKADWECSGWFGIHEYPFRLGMKFPMPKLVLDFLKTTNCSPAQLSPMVWRILLGVDSLCKKHGMEIKVEDLAYQYDVRTQTKTRVTFRSRNKSADLILSVDASNVSWQDKFFFVEKSSVGEWASDVPEAFEEKVIQMAVGDRKNIPVDVAERLNAFLRIDTSERTFPGCMLEDDKEKTVLDVKPEVKPLDVKPLAMISSVGGRTRSKISSAAPKAKTNITSDLMDYIDLTMGKRSDSAKTEDTFSPPKRVASKATSLPPIADVAGTKKRRINIQEPHVKEYHFDNPLITGEHVLENPTVAPSDWATMGFTSTETLKYGLGMLHHAGSVMVAGLLNVRDLEGQKKELQLKLASSDIQAMNLNKKVNELNSRVTELQTKLAQSGDQNRLLQAEVDKLSAEKVEHDQMLKANATLFFQYGRVQTLKNEGAPDEGWVLADEEQKLADLRKKDEEDEVSSTPQVEVEDEQEESAEDDVDPKVD